MQSQVSDVVEYEAMSDLQLSTVFAAHVIAVAKQGGFTSLSREFMVEEIERMHEWLRLKTYELQRYP